MGGKLTDIVDVEEYVASFFASYYSGNKKIKDYLRRNRFATFNIVKK